MPKASVKSTSSGARGRAITREYLEKQGTPLLMPSAKSFKDVFDKPTGAKETVAVITSDTKDRINNRFPKMSIGNYVSFRTKGGNIHTLYAKPKRDLIQKLEKSLILIDYDEIYFEIIDRGEGNGLVIAKYNQILGSRNVAIIDPRTVPLTHKNDPNYKY